MVNVRLYSRSHEFSTLSRESRGDRRAIIKGWAMTIESAVVERDRRGLFRTPAPDRSKTYIHPNGCTRNEAKRTHQVHPENRISTAPIAFSPSQAPLKNRALEPTVSLSPN